MTQGTPGARILSDDDGIVVLAIDRPDRGNSVTPQLMVEVEELLDKAEADPNCKAIVLTGTGKVFCSGADVTEMRDHVAEHGVDAFADYMVDAWLPRVQQTFRKVRAASPLVIAALNGAAIGGGMALALLCDIRVGYRGAKMGESHVNVGVLPGAGSMLHMKAIMGEAATLRGVLSGEHMTAEQAHELGLIDELVDEPGDVVTAAVELARKLTKAGRAYVAASKAIMRDGDLEALDRHFEICLRENRALFKAPGGTDGLARALAPR